MNYIINFRYVKLISYILAKKIQSINNESHVKKYMYYYSLQAILGSINELLLVMIISLFIGTFKETMVVTGSFMFIRVVAGGFHFNSYTKCAYATLIILLSGGLIAKYIYIYISLLSTNIIFLLALILLTLFSPRENKNRQITKRENKLFKIFSITNLFVLYLINVYLSLCDTLRQSLIIGIAISVIIIIPFLNILSNHVDK